MCHAYKTKKGYKVTGVKKTFKTRKAAKAKVRKVAGAIHASRGR